MQIETYGPTINDRVKAVISDGIEGDVEKSIPNRGLKALCLGNEMVWLDEKGEAVLYHDTTRPNVTFYGVNKGNGNHFYRVIKV